MQFKSCYKALKYMLPLFFVGGIAWAQQRKEDRPLKIKLERPLSTARPSGSEVINQVSCKNDPVTPGVPSYLIVNEVNEKTVSLSWNNTEALNGLFEDFESHEDFEVNSSGMIGWKYVDLDKKNSYMLSCAVYPNEGSKLAYNVFNPSKV